MTYVDDVNVTRYLSVAADVAAARMRTSPPNDFFLGSVGIRPDGLIVSSFNVTTRRRCPAGHAEHRLASKLRAGSVVFVARIVRDGTWAMAKPCVHCENRLRNAGVRRVYYTVGEGEYGVLRL